MSECATAIVAELEALNSSIDQFAPEQQRSRFGNMSYRAWFDQMLADSTSQVEVF
jgi:hypothetical protein